MSVYTPQTRSILHSKSSLDSNLWGTETFSLQNDSFYDKKLQKPEDADMKMAVTLKLKWQNIMTGL